MQKTYRRAGPTLSSDSHAPEAPPWASARGRWISRAVLAVVGAMAAGYCTGAAWTSEYQPFKIKPYEEMIRGGRVEFYGIGQWFHADDMVFPNVSVPQAEGPPLVSDIRLTWGDTGMGGFGMAYAINDFWTINTEFAFGSAPYQASWGDSYLSGKMMMNSGSVNVEYNILPTRFTPFVTGGLGYYYFDTGVPSGPPGYWCWWNSWWGGYYCTGATPTYNATQFTLSAGGGLRWDVSNSWFLKALGGVTWVDMGNGSGWSPILRAGVEIGGKF